MARPNIVNVTAGGDFKIEQTQGDFKKVYESLDKVGQGMLRKQLRRELGAASKKARMRVRDSEREFFPAAMRKKYARVPVQAIGTTGHNISLKWRQRLKGTDYQALNRGRLRHPLFGNRKFWYNQPIPAGFFTDSVEKEMPQMRSELVENLTNIIEREFRA